jgi:cellulose synthase/poly-beta-1,6-N-acetylglucosamine synthase-like glycosyltransferase
MFIIYLLYLLCFLVLWWGYFGYFIFLKLFVFANNNSKRIEDDIVPLPTLTILVPCYNEENLIEWKIENLSQLEYPRDKLEVIFLDGCSTDTTVQKIRDAIWDHPYMRVIETGKKGKIPQVNHILPEIQSDIIVNTDVDAELNKDVLLEIAKEFRSDEQVGVVGAFVIPKNCCKEEAQYWATQNKARVLESQAYSSSIVIAPCFAFRRGIVTTFPDDVIADDIYTAFEATVKGYKVVYCKNAVAFETRTPTTMKELVKHKFRKTNAYITEVLRFLYHLPKLNAFWRIIFLTRTLQVIGQAWVLLLFLMLTISLLTMKQYEPVLWCLGTAFLSLGITHLVIGKTDVPEFGKSGGLFLSLKVFAVATYLLILAGLTYPIYRQTSSYERIKQTPNKKENGVIADKFNA